MAGRRLANTSLPWLAAFFMLAGAMHFVRPMPYVGIMPPWLPSAALLVAVSGFAEIAGGAGVLVPATRRAAGVGLILLLVAVFPANIYMLILAIAGAKPRWWQSLLWLRLPLQPLMIWWVWRAAIRPDRRGGRQA
jgi:uncharacterized membrane protein